MPNARNPYPPGMPGSFNIRGKTGTSPKRVLEPADTLSQFADASPEQMMAFQRERDTLFASMTKEIEAKVDLIITSLATGMEVREKELIKGLQQAQQAGYQVPANLTLPWFKHGLRGFLRKIWYGSSQDNPDWGRFQGTSQAPPNEEVNTPFVPRKDESTLPTLVERLYIEQGINALVDRYLPVNEAMAADTIINSVSSLKQDLLQIINGYLHQLYHVALTHGVRLKGGLPKELETGEKKPVAGAATAVPSPTAKVKKRAKKADSPVSPETEPDLYSKEKLQVPPPEAMAGKDVQKTLFDKGPSDKKSVTTPAKPPPSELPPKLSTKKKSALKKLGRPPGIPLEGDDAIKAIISKSNKAKAVGKPGGGTLTGLLRELVRRGVNIFDVPEVRHAIKQVEPKYRDRGSFVNTYAKKLGLDLKDQDAIYKSLDVSPLSRPPRETESPESDLLPPSEDEGPFFGQDSGDPFESVRQGFIDKLRNESTPLEKVRLFTRLLKEKN